MIWFCEFRKARRGNTKTNKACEAVKNKNASLTSRFSGRLTAAAELCVLEEEKTLSGSIFAKSADSGIVGRTENQEIKSKSQWALPRLRKTTVQLTRRSVER